MTAVAQLSPPPNTAGQLACSGVDPELFYGPADSPPRGRVLAWEQRALAVCAWCPVRAACLAAALEFPIREQHGVIGGMTAGQRQALLRTSGYHQPSRSSITDTPTDRRRLVAAAVRLHQAGHKAPHIAAQLGVGERMVHRWLAAHRADLAGRARALPEGVA